MGLPEDNPADDVPPDQAEYDAAMAERYLRMYQEADIDRAALRVEASIVRAAAVELLSLLELEYVNGVKNGYFPAVGEAIDRARAALGMPPLERFGGGK